MKKFITNLLICLALCVTTPGAFAGGKGNGNAGGTGAGDNGNGNAFGELSESDPVVIESAAQSISIVIAAEAGGDNKRYLKYARKLAQTLDQKSSAELDRILQSGNHFGLGK